ncbi:N-succinylarginine dihydrolase [Echinimonas agarilytica]|uniref:N-succinylarginine dihydrolase n=1 Tax=Echinimonas agarilytica TaxID=1215918 RepID=A0AA41W6I0_9GAMM|nr:N-succinylarginine dihydrolase [Echinimonas agarilytica]MCM2679760.1 N-succinylarginine dihydrolase [Echinimonas agarilytica]
MSFKEFNFDGLVGPHHNYAGLSFGNIASTGNAQTPSNPQKAALQGLSKMRTLLSLGIPQGVLAPQQRPDVSALRNLGFIGTDADVIRSASQQCPAIFQSCMSASSMWTANAATVSPSPDCANGKVNFTAANLVNKYHRSLEPEFTRTLLQRVFPSRQHFHHHAVLPMSEHFGDEGAANHTRLCSNYGTAGVELFVYGKVAFDGSVPSPKKFPARQTLEASQAVARKHGLSPSKVVYAQQNPDVIDAGVFHNDVISVGNSNALFYHELAFAEPAQLKADLTAAYEGHHPLHLIEVKNKAVSVSDAIQSYLFNTQLITLENGSMALVAPTECQKTASVETYLKDLMQQNTPIQQVEFIDVKQSMANGGGPACLRLRVVLNDVEAAAVNQACLMSETKIAALEQCIKRYYRDRVEVADLADMTFIQECHEALDQLTQLLDLGSIYPFQQSF